MMAAIEQLLSDWLKEDIIIVSHAVFFNVTFWRDTNVFKRKQSNLLLTDS